MGLDVYAELPGGRSLPPAALRDFEAASRAVIETAGRVWGDLDEGHLRGGEPFGAVCDLMHTSGNGEGWSVDQVKTGAIHAWEEYQAMKDRGEFADNDKLMACASALGFIMSAAQNDLEIVLSF